MNRQALMDLLSEILMLTTGGVEFYGVAAKRAEEADVSQYEMFSAESARLRDRLAEAIAEAGGDPNYISPVSRVAQYTAERLMQSAMITEGLTLEEQRIVDLEVTIITADTTMNHWKLLVMGGGEGLVAKAVNAVAEAVGQKEASEDPLARVAPLALEAVASVGLVTQWARRTWESNMQRMLTDGPASGPVPSEVMTNNLTPVEHYCAAPMKEGLLEGAGQVIWMESPLLKMPLPMHHPQR